MASEDDKLSQSYSRFVPFEFIQALGKTRITDVELGDFVEREMALLFTDIRNFTTLAEQMTPAESLRFLNSYLKRFSPIVQHCGGFIDKFIGDEIMAIFEAADSALKAAIEMRIELRIYNGHRANSGYQPIETGIGAHYGPLILGTIGSTNRLDTTVIGDTVNLAARIENLTKVFKIPLIITDGVVKKLKSTDDYLLREIDSVRVRGKKNPIVLYECFDIDRVDLQENKAENLAEHMMGLMQYKLGDFAQSKGHFEACHEACPEDPIPLIYLSRIESLQRNPPKNWTGISRFKT